MARKNKKDIEEDPDYINNLRTIIEERKREEESNKEAEDKKLKELLGKNSQAGEGELDEQKTFEFDMKPREVKEYLDKYVINQDKAKKLLSNAVCYHFRRVAREMKNPNAKNGHIKKNVLLVGNTGVGKTYLVNKLAQLIGVPFVKGDMTKFSATGYVGGNVEDVVRDLYIKAERKKQLAEMGVIYLDEFDKIAVYSATVGKDVNGLEVQRGLLKMLEETEVDIAPSSIPLGAIPSGQDGNHNGKISTRNILFICSGAFPGIEEIVKSRGGQDNLWKDNLTAYDFINYGFEAELVGRLPIRAVLNDLTADDLYNILTKSEDSIIPKYQEDFREYGIELTFSDDALKEIAKKASLEKTGARALIGCIEEILLDFMYELPSTKIGKLEVTPELIKDPKKYIKNILEGEYEKTIKSTKGYQEDTGVVEANHESEKK